MRVLTVVPLPPGPRGGVEDYAYSVVRHLRDRLDITVVAPRAREDVVEPLEGVDTRLVRAVPLLRRRWPRAGEAVRVLRESIHDADLVHVHMPAPRLERLAAEIAEAEQVPLAVTYHMDAIYDGGSRDARVRPWGRLLQSAYDRLSARPTLDRASVIVTNANGYGRESRLLPAYEEHLQVLRQGVDRSHTHAADRGVAMRERLAPNGARLLVFLGRLVPYKGIPYLVAALDRLPQKDVVLAIAGRGPLRRYLEVFVAKRGLGDRVRFLGFVPDAEVASLLSAADVVACPSISLAESTPIVLLEALACGTPVVGTRLGGSEESLPDDGVRGRLVPPRDGAALAEAIGTLLHANPWSPSRNPGPVRTWEEVADDYLRLFREFVSE